MSGPAFLAAYAAAFVLAGIGTALIRANRRKKLAAAPGTGWVPADPYTVAVLSGGRTRVVDTAVHALVAEGRLRVGRDHRITSCGAPAPADRVAGEVVHAVSGTHGATLTTVRDRVAHGAAVDQVVAHATARGLLLTPNQRASSAVAELAPMLAVFCAGTARLGYGVHRHHPVGLLLAELAVSAMVLLMVGGSTPRRTPAAERMLEQARGAAPAHAGAPAVFGGGNPLAPAAVMGVALIGAGAVMDGDLREALFGGLSTSSASGGGAGCGTDSGGGDSGGGGCGGGGCGGGCGGCGG
ncbi:TIGR04222 domain-containing membrane protein [Streptomyces sp. NPDC021020]|uniref:TIGR04222 domain-containing membrane protein n=1 Tax=Streptomyces sp. NPDC021020 TaxID=3365109 RepID=UPI0037A4D1D4